MRILDLASHDGRFSYACLKLGAAHVTGVEARPHLVANAVDNLSQSGFDPSSFAFMQGDVFDYLPKVQEGEYDTVLCFGVFYHTVRQIELLREIERIKPKYFILDTAIEKEVTVRRLVRHRFLSRLTRLILSIRPRHIARLSNSLQGAKRRLATSTEGQPCLVFRHEGVEAEGATIDSLELVAWPTQSFIEQFFEHYGYKSRQLNWDQNEIKDWTMMEDYEFGYRVSYLAEVLQKRTV